MTRNYGGSISLTPRWPYVIAGYFFQYLNEIMVNFGYEWIDFNPSLPVKNDATWFATFEQTNAYIISHYTQFWMTGKFGFHDRGRENNVKLYGEVYAPEIDLSILENDWQNETRFALLNGDDDFFASERDVERLKESIKGGKWSSE
jgi:hypothetical protein